MLNFKWEICLRQTFLCAFYVHTGGPHFESLVKIYFDLKAELLHAWNACSSKYLLPGEANWRWEFSCDFGLLTWKTLSNGMGVCTVPLPSGGQGPGKVGGLTIQAEELVWKCLKPECTYPWLPLLLLLKRILNCCIYKCAAACNDTYLNDCL